jgi:putative cell wall-binding protein
VAAFIPTPDGESLPRELIVRLDGSNRYAVAVSISTELSRPAPIGIVYLVAGTAYADAVAAGPAAGRGHGVILYTAKDSLPAETADELVRLQPATVEVVGSEAAIGDAVIRQAAPCSDRAAPSIASTARIPGT